MFLITVNILENCTKILNFIKEQYIIIIDNNKIKVKTSDLFYKN